MPHRDQISSLAPLRTLLHISRDQQLLLQPTELPDFCWYAHWTSRLLLVCHPAQCPCCLTSLKGTLPAQPWWNIQYEGKAPDKEFLNRALWRIWIALFPLTLSLWPRYKITAWSFASVEALTRATQPSTYYYCIRQDMMAHTWYLDLPSPKAGLTTARNPTRNSTEIMASKRALVNKIKLWFDHCFMFRLENEGDWVHFM